MAAVARSSARKSHSERTARIIRASACSGGKLAVDGGDQLSSDIDVELPIEFTNSRRARDVDFGQIVADHVEARKQYAFAGQRGAHLVAQPAVALGQRPAFAPGPHDQVAAAFARGRD